MQTTFGCARYSAAVLSPMPPVGHSFRSANGPAKPLSIARPPTAVAGNSLHTRKPRAISASSSVGVAAPGTTGSGARTSASASAGGVPGVTMKSAPASIACCSWVSVSTVPAPILMCGSSRLSIASASIATGVRRVSSIAGRPPSSSAAETRRASSRLCTVTTGRMPAARRSCSAVFWYSAIVMAISCSR